tara:strand:+ start:3568 stop:4536 length:969 start_codon:yes stop_codon:yes gene_type:complete
VEQVISKTELNNIRSSDKRLVSINDSGLCSTIISYVGALRIRDDALLYRPSRDKLVELKYPYSPFGSQSFGLDGNILEEYTTHELLDEDITYSDDKFAIFEGDTHSDKAEGLQFFYQWGRVDYKKITQWGTNYHRDLDYSIENLPSLENFIFYLKEFEKRLNPLFLQKVDEYSSNFNDKTISVHLRTGNNMDWTQSKVEFKKYQDMTSAIEREYYKMIDKYDDSYNFFLSCDNDELLTRFKDKYGDRILTFDDEVETSSRALLDVFLLSKNKNMILYHNSNFSEVAWLLAGAPRSIKVVSYERFTNPFWEHTDEEQISLLSE